MKKNRVWQCALRRALLGFPIGVAIGHSISLLGSFVWGQGQFYPCVPAFEQTVGQPLTALALQTLLCGLLGSVFAACSLVWQVERWSLLRQTVWFFCPSALAMLVVAYLCFWMEHSLAGVLSYLAVYILIFAAIWGLQYLGWKRRIAAMDRRVRQREQQPPQGE